MLENRLVAGFVSLVVASGCFAGETVNYSGGSVNVSERSANTNLVKTLRLHEEVMLKLINKTTNLEKEVERLQKKIANMDLSTKSSSSAKEASVSSKYDKEFRAYIEASKKK
jgi:hypothetical protein